MLGQPNKTKKLIFDFVPELGKIYVSFQDNLECNDDLSSINKTAEMDNDVENKDEECNQMCQQIIGIIFVLVGQV